jgi:hypothetical protein
MGHQQMSRWAAQAYQQLQQLCHSGLTCQTLLYSPASCYLQAATSAAAVLWCAVYAVYLHELIIKTLPRYVCSCKAHRCIHQMVHRSVHNTAHSELVQWQRY